jgi:uncharacterized protein YjbI with pentapeptide repeats
MSSALNFSKQILTEESFKGRDLSRINFKITLLKYLLVVIASVLFGFLQATSSFVAIGIIEKAVEEISGKDQFFFVTLGMGVILFAIAVMCVNQGLVSLFTNFFGMAVAGTIAGIAFIAVALKAGWVVEIVGASVVTMIVIAVSAITVAGLIVITNIGIGLVAAIISAVIVIAIAVTAARVDLFYLPKEFQSFVVILSVAFALSLYIVYRAYSKDPRLLMWWQWGLAFGAFGNTNFSFADLTDADFSEANLKRVNFSNAKLRRTNFQHVQNLQWADVRNTILFNPDIRELLVTGKGKKQSFASLNLKGAYLVNADLRYCDLTDVNLEDADLHDAKLQDADLSQAKVLNVDFSNANLTGACIENWLIDRTTKLKNIQCDFVYLQKDKRDRYPESRNFDQGEFARLCDDHIKAIKTLEDAKKNVADLNADKKDLVNLIKELAKNSGIHIGAINAVDTNLNISEVMDAVNNTIEQLPKTHAELKNLLTKLKLLIEKSQLNDKDKNIALAYVRNITEIYQQHT